MLPRAKSISAENHRDWILVTGGAGFIGSNFVLHWIQSGCGKIVNLDKLTYAGNLSNLQAIAGNDLHAFIHGDINDRATIQQILARFRPRAVIHFAAESHVDRSIHGPAEFVQTNVNGTFTLLDLVTSYWRDLTPGEQASFRFLHVSTDEVYGSLNPTDAPFTETTPYAPNSPYAASKAAADHLVRAYFHTYGLPVITTNCSNNYGPFQFPEKLIPLTILNASRGKNIPVYGDGLNVRDWLYVEDHCAALATVLERGVPGETYNIGGNSEKTNLDVVKTICSVMDQLLPTGEPHASKITFVTDRPGHDRRYAIDASKLKKHSGWEPGQSFESGIQKTVRWYLDHQSWLDEVSSGAYRNWIATQYASV